MENIFLFSTKCTENEGIRYIFCPLPTLRNDIIHNAFIKTHSQSKSISGNANANAINIINAIFLERFQFLLCVRRLFYENFFRHDCSLIIIIRYCTFVRMRDCIFKFKLNINFSHRKLLMGIK